jgi:hypothetical protein
MDESLRGRFIALGTLFVVVAMIGIVLSSFYRKTATSKTFVLPADITACDEDHDCGLSNQLGCCPCEAAGAQGAVNKRMRPTLKAFLQHACRDRVACINVAACRVDMAPVCRNHQCVLVTAAAQRAGQPAGGEE